jgi:hypothetical protein
MNDLKEGNFHFSWKAVAATGVVEGEYEQTIYGENFKDAVDKFVSFHGDFAPNEDGVCLVLTHLHWEPV